MIQCRNKPPKNTLVVFSISVFWVKVSNLAWLCKKTANNWLTSLNNSLFNYTKSGLTWCIFKVSIKCNFTDCVVLSLLIYVLKVYNCISSQHKDPEFNFCDLVVTNKIQVTECTISVDLLIEINNSRFTCDLIIFRNKILLFLLRFSSHQI